MDSGLETLRPYLEAHYRGFDYERHRRRDPIHLLEPFRGGDPRCLEVVGLIAAALAYGRVDIIVAHVTEVLRRFALAHLGISRRCAHRRIPAVCGRCALEPVCLLGRPPRPVAAHARVRHIDREPCPALPAGPRFTGRP